MYGTMIGHQMLLVPMFTSAIELLFRKTYHLADVQSQFLLKQNIDKSQSV